MTLEEKQRKSNPWAVERRGRDNCFRCQTDEDGDCWRDYSLVCEECGAEYFGESDRNAFTRGAEHLLNKEAQDENRSVLKLHANHHHGGADVRFNMKVTGLHNDSLDRQVTEGVNIANFRGDVLMNRRGELGGVRIERQQYRRWGTN